MSRARSQLETSAQGCFDATLVISSAPSSLRVRLEGALERLEAAGQTYQALCTRLQQSNWSQHLAELDLPALEQSTEQARKALVHRLDQDDQGEGELALRTLVESRALFRQAVLSRARELGVATRGKLGEVIKRLRREFPLRYQGEVLAPGEPRAWWLLMTPWLLLLLAQWSGAERALVRAFVALAGLGALAWGVLTVKLGRPQPVTLTVGKRTLALGGQAVPLSTVISTERRLTTEARTEVTITLKGRRPISVVTATDEAVRLEAALAAAARPTHE